ncbi:unnamed protein product [Brassica napus]|uniref:(rape) hypothetical protein n=1 Tax=Brassica napus TaxID=3708 RepID=A0A816JR57_BRANA|nr:unnamed protein product [Brassica napus]
METISGGRNVGSSSGGTLSKEIRTNTGEGLCNSCIVVMAGRWIMFDNGAWDFKIDNDRMGRAVDSSRIRDSNGQRFQDFKALHRADKSVNLFVTLRESVGGEMIFLRSERVIRVQMNAPVRPPDEDVAFLMEVQQIEERYKRNSQSGGMVATSKDQDKSGETLDDGKDTRTLSVEQVSVENGNNGGAHEDVAAEDEGDDIDYDYNGWHDYCRNDCVTDDDDDFVEGPGKGRSGGQSGGKGIRRPGGTGAAKSACEILDHPPDWTQK